MSANTQNYLRQKTVEAKQKEKEASQGLLKVISEGHEAIPVLNFSKAPGNKISEILDKMKINQRILEEKKKEKTSTNKAPVIYQLNNLPLPPQGGLRADTLWHIWAAFPSHAGK